MQERQIIQHLRTNETNVKPKVSEIEYGEIAINYKKDEEKIFIKNDNDELVTFVSDKIIAKKQDIISDLDNIRSNAAKGATALQSVPAEYVTEMELANKNYATSSYVIGELNSKSDTGHTHTEFTTLQNNINTKVNASDYNAKINELDATDTSLENRIITVENYTVPDARANVLWIGTSIPAGDIQHGNNGTTQSTTTNLGSNNYPKMVADALGFNLYNNSRGSSFVCFYPPNEDGTANWASASDWSEYSSEVWKGYSLSASFAQVDEKFGPNGLNCPQWLINNFKSYSYESLIIPYIDGTLASCDTVVIDHGYNDRKVIINEASWHPNEEETQFAVGAGRDWLLKLQDPFETTLETETYFQGKWWNDESVSSKKHYMSAMIFLAKKIWAVNPRIKIIIGNYFASKSNVFGAEFGNDRLSEFVHLSNSAIASWLRCQCVEVWRHTGIYNRNLAAGNDYQIFCPDNVHPHSDSTGRSNRIIAGIYINALRGICYN